MIARALRSLASLALVVAAGCSQGATMPPPGDPCKSLAAECVGKQQACVADAMGARCEACPEGRYAASSGACEAIGGTLLAHDFAPFTTQSGQEVLGLCQSWTLNNPTEMWVNAVQLDQDVASHHSNWTFVPDDQFNGPDGVWMCQDRMYSQLTAALAGGVLYAQSTQATHEVQKFPNGAAVRIPPYSRIIGDVHLLNTSMASVTGHARLTVYSLPAAEVKVKLVPFHLTYDGLDLPPHAASRFTGDCLVRASFPDSKLAMSIYYILPHTHALATKFFTAVYGGPDDGKSLLKVEGFSSDAHGRAFDPPIDMSKSNGLSFGCQYLNPRSKDVKWGFGDQEMCELLGFADSSTGFESTVATAMPAGMDGDVQLFTGACTTLAFPWDALKPGGPGPM